jgi:membrane-bound metal-dependent hydrolase YbcI (DUF457 family)
MTGIVASSASHGWASPDVDQTKPWTTLRRALPGSVDQVLNHRVLTHWWGLPVLAWWAAGGLPGPQRWVVFALIIGWTSHLVGDVVFGHLPLLPWGGPTVGLGLKTGGRIESGVAVVMAAALAWVLFWPDAATEPTRQLIVHAERNHP